MKRNNGKPKTMIERKLKAKGLSCNRVWLKGERVWKLSNGEVYKSLADIWAVHKPKKGEEEKENNG